MLHYDIEKIGDFVESVLKKHPETRNSDKELYLKAMELNGIKFSDQDRLKFMRMPSFETLRRRRQEIQASGRWTASSAVQQKRLLKSHQI